MCVCVCVHVVVSVFFVIKTTPTMPKTYDCNQHRVRGKFARKTRQTRSTSSKAHIEEQLQLEKIARSADKAHFEETIKECKAEVKECKAEVVRLKDAAIVQGRFTHDVEEISAQCKLKAESAIVQAKTEAAVLLRSLQTQKLHDVLHDVALKKLRGQFSRMQTKVARKDAAMSKMRALLKEHEGLVRDLVNDGPAPSPLPAAHSGSGSPEPLPKKRKMGGCLTPCCIVHLPAH